MYADSKNIFFIHWKGDTMLLGTGTRLPWGHLDNYRLSPAVDDRLRKAVPLLLPLPVAKLGRSLLATMWVWDNVGNPVPWECPVLLSGSSKPNKLYTFTRSHGDYAPSHGQSPESPSLERQNSILLMPLGNLNLSLYTATPHFIIKIFFILLLCKTLSCRGPQKIFCMASLAWKVVLRGLLKCIVFRSYPVLQIIKKYWKLWSLWLKISGVKNK